MQKKTNDSQSFHSARLYERNKKNHSRYDAHFFTNKKAKLEIASFDWLYLIFFNLWDQKWSYIVHFKKKLSMQFQKATDAP